MFGLGNTGQGTGFQTIQFDSGLLGAYYESRSLTRMAAMAPSATPSTSSTRGPAVDTPWDKGGDDRSLDRRVNEVRNIGSFIDERSSEARMAGDDKDAKALFTMYRALTRLQAIAEYSAKTTTTDATRGPLDVLLQRGLREIQDYMASVDLDKLDLLYGAKSNRVESAVTVGRNDTKIVGSVIQRGARTDPINGLNGDEIFTLTMTKHGETRDINIDLSEIPGPVSMDALVSHVNSRISAFQASDAEGAPLFDDQGNPVPLYTTRFNVESVDGGGLALGISGLTGEQVSLSAAAPEPSLFLAGSTRGIATDSLNASTLTRLDGIDSDDPNRALRQNYSATSDPILEVTDKDAAEDEESTSEAAAAIRKQASDLITELGGDEDDDGVIRPPADTRGSGVAVDSQGQVFVVGTTAGDIDNQINRSGGDDVFLSKYDASGNLVWQRMLGSSGSAEGYGIAIDSQDNVVVVGQVDGELAGNDLFAGQDSFAVKFDNSGDRLWTRQLDSLAQDAATGVTIDGNDDIFISGYASGVFTSGQTHGGGRDAYVARLSGDNGSLAAATQYGGAGNETASAVAMADDGNVLVAGEEDGRVVLRKLDRDDLSNTLWVQDLGAVQSGSVTGIAVEGSAVYVAGHTGNADFAGTNATAHQGGQDGFVTRIDDAGGSASAAWTSYVGTGAGDFIEDITVSGGQVYVAGRTGGDLGGGKTGVTDAFAAKISGDDGSHTWTEQLGGVSGFNGAAGLAFSSAGNSALTALGLGPGTLQNTETRDVATQTTLRPGDHFYMSINDGPKRKVTIQEGDTFARIASRINRMSLRHVNAEASFTGNGFGLKIAVKNDSTIQLFAGKEGNDALASLGMQPTRIMPADKSFGLNEEDDALGGVFGMNIETGLRLSTGGAAQYTLGSLNDAIGQVQRAFRSLSPNPLKDAMENEQPKGPVPAHLSAQLANYQNGLNRLMSGGGGGGAAGGGMLA